MKHDAPVDPATTREVGREEFKPPAITEGNVASLLKLQTVGAGLPASAVAGLKRQAGFALLQGIAQEERKRAFKAISVFVAWRAGQATEQELNEALTPFEIGLLEQWFVEPEPASKGVVIQIESRPAGGTEG